MKRKLTELPITIVTDDEHKTGDNLELTRQRIERAAMYLMSIFNLIKVSALHFEGESESKPMSNFFEDVNNHCEVGYGIADSVLASATALTEFQPDGESDSSNLQENQTPILNDFFTGKFEKTAEKLQTVFNSDEASKEVKNILNALIGDAAANTGVSIPDERDMKQAFLLILDAFQKESKYSVSMFYTTIETVLNHGTNGKEI